MNENNKDSRKKIISSVLPIGLCIGIAIGTAVGVAAQNIGLWMPIGLCLGLALGCNYKNTDDNEDDTRDKQ